MHRLRPILVFVAFACISAIAAYADRTVADTGHIGAVNDMVLSADGSLLVTAGDDGTVRFFNARTGALRRRLQASPFAISRLALHPTLPRVAVVETDGVSIRYLTVWDYEKRESLYSIRLSDEPLDLGFSPKGSYLIYTHADWKSVEFLESDRGVELKSPTSLREPRFGGFGIVDSFFVSNSENTFVAYLPSGSLQYRSTTTGEVGSRITAPRNLTNLTFLADTIHAIGRRQNDIVAINIVTGQEVDTIRYGNLIDFSVDRESGEVLLLYADIAGNREFALYTLQNDRFVSRYSLYQMPEMSDVTSLVLSNRTVFTAGSTGSIYQQTRYRSSPSLFSENRLKHLDSILPGDTTLVTAADRIFSVNFEIPEDGKPRIIAFSRPNPLTEVPTTVDDTNTFSGLDTGTPDPSPPQQEPTPRQLTDAPQETVGETGIQRLANDLYLLYDRGGTSGKLAYYSAVEGLIQFFEPIASPPLVSLDVRGFDLLTVDSAGKVAVSNLFSRVESFTYQRFGIRTAVFGDEPYVIAAGQRSGVPRTTTQLINTATYETVPLENQSTLTYALTSDTAENTVYSISVDSSSERRRTTVTRHSGDDLGATEVIHSEEGEFFDGALASYRGVVYFSVAGRSFLKRSGSDRFTEIESNGRIPRRAAIYRDWVFAINRDSTISVWEIATGAHLADFSIFKSGDWVALTPDGAVLGSSRGASAYLNSYN